MSKPMSNLLSVKAPLVQLDAYEAPLKSGWRQAFAYGVTRHPVRDFTVDAQFCDAVVASFAYMRDTYGYLPPICVEHDVELDFDKLAEMPPLDVEGEQVDPVAFMQAVLDRQGHITRGVTWGVIEDVEHVRGVGLSVKPVYRPAAQILENMGLLLYVSPSFFPEWIDPHTGKVLRNMLREFTHCGIPHQKNLATPAQELYALSETGFVAQPKESTEEDNMDETLEKILEMLGSLQAGIDSMGAEEEADTMEDMEEEGAELSEVDNSDLAQQVAMLRAQLEERDALPGVIERLNCTAEQAQALAPLAIHNAATFGVVCELVEQAKTSDASDIERPMRGHADSVDNAETGDMTAVVVALAEEAASTGVSRKDAAQWIANKAGAQGFKAQDVFKAIAPELISPAYNVNRH